MFIRNVLSILVLIAVFSSCKKDKEPEFVPADPLTLIAGNADLPPTG